MVAALVLYFLCLIGYLLHSIWATEGYKIASYASRFNRMANTVTSKVAQVVKRRSGIEQSDVSGQSSAS